MLWDIRQRQGCRQMLKLGKVCLFVPAVFFACQPLLCLQNTGQWATGLQGGPVFFLLPLRVQIQVDQEVSLVQALLHMGQTARSYTFGPFRSSFENISLCL